MLEGPDARHLVVVRRAKPGDRIRASDGAGRTFEAAIDSITKDRVDATVTRERSAGRPSVEVSVFQGLAKAAKVDFVVQKLTELGVDQIVIFNVGRSVPRWDPAKSGRMRERWEKLAYEASKQSRREWLPKVEGPVDFEEGAEAATRADLCLVADPGARSRLRTVLGSSEPASVSIVVGPEGGLSAAEVEAFTSRGGAAVSAGEQILRTETAGTALASIVMYEYGRLG